MERCGWCGTDPVYVAYHDEEWGVPNRDDRSLFEALILDGAQAGLSWITILKRREGYRAVFDNFDAKKMASYSERDLEKKLQDTRIIRNRLKVESARNNARAYLSLLDQGQTLSDFLWGYVDGRPIQNSWRTLDEVPAETPLSQAVSRDLKKLGFNFVGPTIIYAMLQACGFVNDHLITCPRHGKVKDMA